MKLSLLKGFKQIMQFQLFLIPKDMKLNKAQLLQHGTVYWISIMFYKLYRVIIAIHH